MAEGYTGPLRKSGESRYEIPIDYKKGMRVKGIVYAEPSMLDALRRDGAPEQVANVAFLPGIVGASLAMPDVHQGYGFPIGGVAATSVDHGVVSPGGVGYDINCGVRLLLSNLTEGEVRPRMQEILAEIFSAVPCGAGGEGRVRVSASELDEVLVRGSRWAVESGFGEPDDCVFCEEGGAMSAAFSGAVGEKARKRSERQLGTLGSGNHFIEVSLVETVFDQPVASAFGLRAGGIVFQIHSGSRGLGHQVCTDFLGVMTRAMSQYSIELPDRQLACAPVKSPEGKAYLGAMAAAANYAWANRQVMTHLVRQSVAKAMKRKSADLEMRLVYDVAHNIAKIERHTVNDSTALLCVHRKGATRAFPAGHDDLPAAYLAAGQPVLMPGDMGRASFVMVGTARGMLETFGSCAHGAGRVMSRTSAKKELSAEELKRQLLEQGVTVMAKTRSALVEEAPHVYKDVELVASACEHADLATRVARLRPLGVIKG